VEMCGKAGKPAANVQRCAGDYEDPDFSAWDADVEDDTEISGGEMWAPGGEAEEEE
jgi:hypothetical protein